MNGEDSLFDVPPAAFGRYTVLHPLGAGTTGPIFRGEDSETHAPVVIKVLRMNLSPKRAREVAAGLSALVDRMPAHVALAVPLAAGLEEGEPYLVSAFMPGDGLDAALRNFGPAAIEDLVPRVRLLAEALDSAAKAGFVHGALHPRDIVVSPETTRLAGVGVAPLVARAGAAIPRRKPYVAPEIAGGSDPSPVADQFALAAVTFEWMFGQGIDGPAEARVETPALPGVDGDALSDAFTTALATDPAARFDNCQAFADAIAASVVGGTPELTPIETPELELAPAEAHFGSLELEPAAPIAPHAPHAPIAPHAPHAPIAPQPAEAPVAPIGWQPSAPPAREPERWGNGMLVLTLVVGLIFGFAAGYMARPRALQHPLLATAVPQPEASAAAPAPAPAPAPTPAPPAPKAPLAPLNPGRLLVHSTPSGATVTVDGTARGVTPLAVTDLELGARRVNVAERGYVASEQRVVLTKARPSRSLDVRLVTTPAAKPATAPVAAPKPAVAPAAAATTSGSLVIDSRPQGATVTVDGRERGLTPMTLDLISSGEHAVTIILKGYRPFSTTVRVVAGERARAAASLSVMEQE